MTKNLLQTLVWASVFLPHLLSAQSALYVSTTGSDVSNNCDLPNSPCKTIEYAYSVANAGDTVKIGPGNYNLAATLNVNQAVILQALLADNKPVITSGAADVMSVNSDNVTINGLVFKMGLTNTTGMRGIVSNQQFYNKLKLINNVFESTHPISGTPNTNMVWNSFAIFLASIPGNSDTVLIANNEIKAGATANIFGRGLYLGNGQAQLEGPGGMIVNNKITAYYTIQSVLNNSTVTILSNKLNGITLINAPKSNKQIQINSNTFSGATQMEPSSLYGIVEIRGNDTDTIQFEYNTIENYSTIGLLVEASKNVNVIGNKFTPADTATNFVALMANTKLMTSAVQANTYSDEITIQGNTFNAKKIDKGTAIVFADHYGQNTPAFSKVVIGGPLNHEKNIFAKNLNRFIVLDDQSGPSSSNSLWSGYDVTIMKPFSQNIDAFYYQNSYHYAISGVEDKNIDSLDNNILGRIRLKSGNDTIPSNPNPGVGLEEVESIINNLFPNPTTDFINIEINNSIHSAQLFIVNTVGQVVHASIIEESKMVDVSNYASGVYFIRINHEGLVSTSKFIKK